MSFVGVKSSFSPTSRGEETASGVLEILDQAG